MAYKYNPVCKDQRPCFARENGRCKALSEAYPPGKCPFCKPDRDRRAK